MGVVNILMSFLIPRAHSHEWVVVRSSEGVRSAGGALTSAERECGVEGVERRGRASGSGCNRALSGESHRLLRSRRGVHCKRTHRLVRLHFGKDKVMTGRVGVAEEAADAFGGRGRRA